MSAFDLKKLAKSYKTKRKYNISANTHFCTAHPILNSLRPGHLTYKTTWKINLDVVCIPPQKLAKSHENKKSNITDKNENFERIKVKNHLKGPYQ